MTLLFRFHLYRWFCFGSLLCLCLSHLNFVRKAFLFFSFPLFISMTIREKRLYLAQSKPISTPPPTKAATVMKSCLTTVRSCFRRNCITSHGHKKIPTKRMIQRRKDNIQKIFQIWRLRLVFGAKNDPILDTVMNKRFKYLDRLSWRATRAGARSGLSTSTKYILLEFVHKRSTKIRNKILWLFHFYFDHNMKDYSQVFLKRCYLWLQEQHSINNLPTCATDIIHLQLLLIRFRCR